MALDPQLASELAAKSRPPSRALTYLNMAGPLYAILGLFLALFWVFVFPWLNTQLWPVLIDQNVSQVTYYQKARQVCWVWEFTKLKEAKAVTVEFSVTDTGGDQATVSLWRQDTNKPFDPRAPQRKLGRHRIPLCTELPPDIDSPWVIVGHIDYNTGLPWTTRAVSPPIIPLEGNTTPGDNG